MSSENGYEHTRAVKPHFGAKEKTMKLMRREKC
ncbi:hypothetical protein HY04AAS1_1313 [Hydrogenobaculum sp. Y04AAS1]|nr:hypothetical protein HY04AAS1_1313 [Hydrogenobaculum sp. Y04AAS1]